MDAIDRSNLNDINRNSTSSLPYGADSLKITSYDGDNNPLVIEYYLGGTDFGKLLVTVTLTYDVNGNVTSLNRSR